MLNIALLRETVEWVEAEDELAGSKRHWYQGSWMKKRIALAQQNRDDPYCTTAMCVAGKIAWDLGWVPVWNTDYPGTKDEITSAVKASKTDGSVTVTRSISDIAERALGITNDDARDLFDGGNRAYNIRYWAKEIADNGGYQL